MQQFQPVRFDFEKIFVAREFFRRRCVRRKRQLGFGGGFDFFQEILHGRINCGQNGFNASAARSFCSETLSLRRS